MIKTARKCLRRIEHNRFTRHAHNWCYVAYYLLALMEGSLAHQLIATGIFGFAVIEAIREPDEA